MNFEKIKKLNDEITNVPMVYISGPIDDKKDRIIKFLLHNNIDYFNPYSDGVNSFDGAIKMQIACDAIIMSQGWEKFAVPMKDKYFAEIIGQPILYVEEYKDLDNILQDINDLIKYPKQFLMMRLLHSAMYHLHVMKNKDYSPSNILGTGQAGIATRLWDKCARFMNLIGFDITTGEYTQEKNPKNESILDTLIDASNYALIGIIHKFGSWGK